MIDPDQVMTVREVSLYLKLATSTVYRLAQGGRLPGRKIGGAWRFSRRNLDDWLVKRTPRETVMITADSSHVDPEYDLSNSGGK